MSIFVEINIKADLDDLWSKTQVPGLHQRWDLRFTSIEYLPRESDSHPQKFLYSTRIGFGLKISGEGESVATRDSADGSRTSALKFWSDDPKSLILQGSGYWRYIPAKNGIRFLTWYDYSTRFGALGRAIDLLIFRRLLGWATAWSFDRLRLWLEKRIEPALSLERSLIYGICRVAIAFVWIYHGLVPKLIFQSPDELAMLRAAGMSPTSLLSTLGVIGWLEVTLGLLFLLAWRARVLFVVNIVLMLFALSVVALTSPQYLVAAFNPVTLNVMAIVLSVIGFIVGKDLPSAKACKRRQAEIKS